MASWFGPDGTRYAMTTDIRLTDISRFTSEQVVGKTGQVAFVVAIAHVFEVNARADDGAFDLGAGRETERACQEKGE